MSLITWLLPLKPFCAFVPLFIAFLYINPWLTHVSWLVLGFLYIYIYVYNVPTAYVPSLLSFWDHRWGEEGSRLASQRMSKAVFSRWSGLRPTYGWDLASLHKRNGLPEPQKKSRQVLFPVNYSSSWNKLRGIRAKPYCGRKMWPCWMANASECR